MITEFRIPELKLKQISRPGVYDTFANKYNQSKDKISTVANFITIREGYEKQLKIVNEHISRDQKGLFQPLDNVYNGYRVGTYKLKPTEEELKKRFTSSDEYIQNLIKNAKIKIDAFLSDIKNGYVQLHQTELDLLIKNLEETLSTLQVEIENFSIPELYKNIFLDAVHWCDKYHIASFNLYVLNYLIQDIIFESYPLELNLYKDLSEEEQQGISGNQFKGRTPDAPQIEIKNIVDTLISGINEKGVYTHYNGKGDKKNYQIKHPENGRWEGYNINQIYKFFADNHDNLTNTLSENQFKTRIERSLDHTK